MAIIQSILHIALKINVVVLSHSQQYSESDIYNYYVRFCMFFIFKTVVLKPQDLQIPGKKYGR